MHRNCEQPEVQTWMNGNSVSGLTRNTPSRLKLLTLLLIVLVVVGSAAHQVNGASIGFPLSDVNSIKLLELFNQSRDEEKDQIGVSTLIRQHLLYHKCSEHFVQLIHKGRKGVRAKGKWEKNNMHFSKLWFEPTPRHTIKIRAVHSDLHMCFNRRGKLIARRKHKRRYCEFKEHYSPDGQYTQYELAGRKHSWFVGFNHRGRSLLATDRSSAMAECFNFLKHHNKNDCISGTGQGPKVNFCDNEFLGMFMKKGDERTSKVKRNKLRHQKHHKRRRKVG